METAILACLTHITEIAKPAQRVPTAKSTMNKLGGSTAVTIAAEMLAASRQRSARDLRSPFVPRSGDRTQRNFRDSNTPMQTPE